MTMTKDPASRTSAPSSLIPKAALLALFEELPDRVLDGPPGRRRLLRVAHQPFGERQPIRPRRGDLVADVPHELDRVPVVRDERPRHMRPAEDPSCHLRG